MTSRELHALGEPSLVLGELKLWVHGRQFPNADDYWDGNWLSVTAHYHRHQSSVVADGPFLHLGELWGLYQGCLRMHASLKGEAALECIEPNLSLKLTAGPTGRIQVETTITPDQSTESHSYINEIDLSYLPAINAALASIFNEYPIKEPSELPARRRLTPRSS
jgi:hypothetical protein